MLRVRAGSLHIFHRMEVHLRSLSEFMPSHPQHQDACLGQKHGNRVRRRFARHGNERPRASERIVKLLDASQDVSGETICGKFDSVAERP